MSASHKLLKDPTALAVAQAMLAGFDKHYRIFRDTSRSAKQCFEKRDWVTVQRATRERILFYDQRVLEAVTQLTREYRAAQLGDAIWQQAKLEYIGLLTHHKQPELAETFFNSVFCRIRHRSYFQNDYIFVRPAVSTEYIEGEVSAYRCYYPLAQGLRATLLTLLADFNLAQPFADLRRDLRAVLRAARRALPRLLRLEANHQVQVLSSLFYRNKGAYIVGRIINGSQQYPFAVPVLYDPSGQLYLDALLVEASHLNILFSANRAYFMVDMEVPSAYVEFLQALLPRKPKWELYTILGLQKHGKNLFYRDFLHHLLHSQDRFVIAPGIRGLVMLVFTLPSYPYVFKVIKDVIAPPKDTDRETVKAKYLLVKLHDRVGRMADTLEYSNAAFPADRFSEELLDELKRFAPQMLERDGESLIIKHLYIERRVTPLNLYLEKADDEACRHAIEEVGNAIKQMAAANIFPGDLLFKNFGVTRFGRVVFYDYDEIDYLTACNFRRIPAALHEEDELSAEPWYSVSPNDIFPEQFPPFLLTNARVEKYFRQYHSDLFDPQYWKALQEKIRAGEVTDVFPYPESLRFIRG